MDKNKRFFPVETVTGIGEIKSTLSTKQLCDTLVKLSGQKKLKNSIASDTFCIDTPNVKYDIQNPYDNLFSFIVCESISDFDPSKIESLILSSYEDNSVPIHLRHNVVMSLANGLLGYKDKSGKLQSSTPAVIGSSFLYFPSAKGVELSYALKKDKDAEENFLISLSNFMVNANVYYPDPVFYL